MFKRHRVVNAGARTMRIPALFAAAIIVASGITGLSQSPAKAEEQPAPLAYTDCALGYSCLWRDNDYKTNGYGPGYVRFQYGIPYLSQYYYNGFPATSTYNADKSATSIYNNGRTLRACFYKGTSYTMPSGNPFCLPTGSGRNNLATSIAPLGWNDSIRSARFVS